MAVISLINNKGGVGKTTTAVNLAAGVARKGKSVLLVDLDAQASASLSLGLSHGQLEPSTADVLLDGLDVTEARSELTEGISLLPGSPDLKDTDINLAAQYGREKKLQRALGDARKDYDMILLDCPPSFSLLPVNALVAADYFLVPVTPQYLSLEGVGNLLDTVDEIRDGIGSVASVLGIVITQADYRSTATKEVVEVLRDRYGRRVFETEVRVNVRLSEAPSYGQSIFEYAPTSTGAEAYEHLTEELLRRLASTMQ